MVKSAIELAAKAHDGQFRKGTSIPYIAHPCNVGVLLAEQGCTTTVICAGILHDVIEDTAITIADLRQQFGRKVASIVEKCSEPDKSLPWRERKQHTIEYLAKAPLDVKLISCADKFDNILSIERDYQKEGEELWSRFNASKEDQQWYYHGLVRSLGKGKFAKSPLYGYFKESVFEVFGTPDSHESESALNYLYFDKDGAIFRKTKNASGIGIEDVKTPTGWKPYEGDRLAPVYYGDSISEEEANR